MAKDFIVFVVLIVVLNLKQVSGVDCYGRSCSGFSDHCCGDSIRSACCTESEASKNFCTWDSPSGFFFTYAHCEDDCCGDYYNPGCCTTVLTAAVIAGIVIGILFFIGLGIACVFVLVHTCGKKSGRPTVTPAVRPTPVTMQVVYTNPSTYPPGGHQGAMYPTQPPSYQAGVAPSGSALYNQEDSSPFPPKH